MKIQNKERLYLLSLVKADLRIGELEKTPVWGWDGREYKKDRAKYGLAKLTTMYTIKAILEKG